MPTDRQGGSPLERLARAAGLQTEYTDGLGRQRVASPEAIVAVLRGLGLRIERPEQAADALRALKEWREARPVEPTIVLWQGGRTTVPIRIPAGSRSVRCRVEVEGGGEHVGSARAARSRATGNGAAKVAGAIELPCDLPVGVHTLTLEAGSTVAHSTVLCAPRRCYKQPGPRHLGIFLPLYALRSERDWGVGDLTDLRRLSDWAAARGCGFVGTLPLLASYLGEPFDPSPYAPVSRLFWNELYLDPAVAPDLARSPAAKRLLGSRPFKTALAEQRAAELVDYREVYKLKRRILDLLAAAAEADPQRRRELERFAATNPLVREYAAFRAAAERQGKGWHGWPEHMHRGPLRPADYDQDALRTHLYSQFLLAQQFAGLRADGRGLYLDLPIGVHGDGFDTWRFRSAFARGLSVGAPPDALFTGGQNWGFPPLHPWRSRRDGHAYFRAALRAQLAHCSVLRIDHVMGLHRVFCIPPGARGEDGIYVTQPAAELYAALAIESHRAETEVVGENLGTVPPGVNRELARRGILTISVGQFEFRPDRGPSYPQPAAGALASLNTHDTPTFAGFWTGSEIALRRKLGLLTATAAAAERGERAKLREAVLRDLVQAGLLEEGQTSPALVAAALLKLLAASPGRRVLVNLEDLWAEPRPQNIPGISEGTPNWQRKAARTLEQITGSPAISRLMKELASRRSRPARARPAANHAPATRRGRAAPV